MQQNATQKKNNHSGKLYENVHKKEDAWISRTREEAERNHQKSPKKYNKKRASNQERTKRKCTKMHTKKRAFEDGRLIMQHDNAGAIWAAPGINEHDNAQELIMSLPAITGIWQKIYQTFRTP